MYSEMVPLGARSADGGTVGEGESFYCITVMTPQAHL